MKRKLIAILLSVSCIPLVLCSLYFYWIIQQKTIAEFDESSQKSGIAIQGNIAKLMDEQMAALRVLSKNPYVAGLDVANGRQSIVDTQKIYPGLLIIASDATGQQVMRGDEIKLVNVSQRKFFQTAVKGQETISEVLTSQTTGEPIIVFAMPLQAGGKINGIIQGSFELPKLHEFVKKLSTNQNTVYIVDSDGKLLSHPDGAQAKERKDLSKLDFIQKGKNGESGFETWMNGEQKVRTYYLADKQTGWILCVDTPDSVLAGLLNGYKFRFLGIVAVTLLLITAVGFVYAGRVVKPLTLLARNAADVADGNLTAADLQINSKDEFEVVGQAFNRMKKNLRDLVKSIAVSAEQVAASSEELLASAEQTATVSNDVAATIAGVSEDAEKQVQIADATTGRIRARVDDFGQMTTDAQNVVTATETATKLASDGQRVVNGAVEQMGKLSATVMDSTQTVLKLGKSSEKIGLIVETITNIANQTNLLALNAAIEAARAGEAGRGFAVVAEEVRKLAEQSEGAAKEITDLIRAVQADTASAVTAMDEGAAQAGDGVQAVSTAGTTFTAIVTNVEAVAAQTKKMAGLIGGFADANQAVVQDIDAMTSLSQRTAGQMQNISASTEEQSAAMQEMAVSCRGLAEMAQALQTAVGKFRV
ncbi:MAG: methyl-accepting chemotaxis protein [Negativicutes bacterium]|nr:methyl-accepting chemotaxis protein [Negativicutes bacterium]